MSKPWKGLDKTAFKGQKGGKVSLKEPPKENNCKWPPDNMEMSSFQSHPKVYNDHVRLPNRRKGIQR